MIFNNLYAFNAIGRFGNANPNFVKDWVTMTELDSSSNPSVTFEEGTCKFPSTAFVRLFFQKIGEATDPQITIVKADFKWSQDYK